MDGDDDVGPPTRHGGEPDGGGDNRGPVARFWHAESGPEAIVREILISAGIVLLVGLFLFVVSGVWPPMVAVESASMEPQMYRGDLVLISEPGRYVPADAAQGETGVVTAATGEATGYRTFGGAGSVVVFRPDGRRGTPVIHRAALWVEEGENWYDRSDPTAHNADSCAELRNCPAPHDGFVTKGDNNDGYDQVLGISSPVKPSWIVGVAHLRVPWLGHVRLWLAGNAASGPATVGATAGPGPSGAENTTNTTAPATLAPV